MKTNNIAALLLVAALLSSTLVSASKPTGLSTRSAEERNLDRVIGRHLVLPATDKEALVGEVFISCIITPEGRIEVLECNSANETLKQHVVRKLSKLTLRQADTTAERILHMHVVYKPERPTS